MDFKTIKELLEYSEKIKGKTFKDFDFENKLPRKEKDKGILGKIVETGFYKYKNNNAAEADFADLGVELKVSGYIKTRNGIRAKERIPLAALNYMEIVNEDFHASKILSKNKKTLIIWYEYEKDKSKADFLITDVMLLDIESDLEKIKKDFEDVKQKVMDGLAETISEGDTMYLGACTAGYSSKDKTKQPYSSELAPRRKWSFKNSYITGILRKEMLKIELAVDGQEYANTVEYVRAQIEKYIGFTQIKILEKLIGKVYKEKIPKQISKMITDITVGKDAELGLKNELFIKTNTVIKNLPVDDNGYPIERMSFRTLTLSEFDEEWETSVWKNFFEEMSVIVVMWVGDKKKFKNGFRKCYDVKQISFDSNDIEMFGRSYNMVRNAILSKNTELLPYPSSFSGQILEIAPKGVKGDKAYTELFKNNKTKCTFMISKEFLFAKLNIK